MHEWLNDWADHPAGLVRRVRHRGLPKAKPIPHPHPHQAVGLDPYGGYGTAGSQKRTGEGGGFKEFDEEEDDRRKRRAYEASREKEERKAEKKKCEFCKVRVRVRL